MVRRFYRKALDALLTFLYKMKVQNLLYIPGKTNVAISGDTRFDRVATILEKDNTLDFIAQFKDSSDNCCWKFVAKR
jgi:3-deoxy-D-manno-octulosonic-acid transferase